MDIDSEFDFAPDGAYQELHDELTKVCDIAEKIPGSAAVASIYLPKMGTLDGFAGGESEHLMDTFCDASMRVVEQLEQVMPRDELRAMMLAQIEAIFANRPPMILS